MTGVVLLLSDCSATVANTSAVLESLDHKILPTENIESLTQQVNKPEVLTVFIALQNPALVRDAVAAIKSKAPYLPVYLFQTSEQNSEECQHHSHISGVISNPVRYRDLIEVLRQAKLSQFQSGNKKRTGIPITGESPQIIAIKSLIRQVAPTDANVLISGESGTGKEVVARSIHDLSLRSERPFVAVNCGAIPAELLESELFGHEKGSFTGAFQARAGRFELAKGGTLFLDEIGDMPLNMQVKLLRVIQERTFERVGGTKSLKSDVRIIAATHRDIEQRIEDGEFRMDLYYRLNVFPVELPPLRERSEDIPLLIKDFIKRRVAAQQQSIEFDEPALDALMNNSLPGNVRELQNLVERLGILHPGKLITHDKLPSRYRDQQVSATSTILEFSHRSNDDFKALSESSGKKISLKQYLSSLERKLICHALEQSNWVVTQAAKTLSVQRTTLIEKIRKLEIKQSL